MGVCGGWRQGLVAASSLLDITNLLVQLNRERDGEVILAVITAAMRCYLDPQLGRWMTRPGLVTYQPKPNLPTCFR